VDNHRANAFYRKCGFSLQNTENNYHRYRIQL
jgi:ribosomal protein S18 acetylase RimI-like enzyme